MPSTPSVTGRTSRRGTGRRCHCGIGRGSRRGTGGGSRHGTGGGSRRGTGRGSRHGTGGSRTWGSRGRGVRSQDNPTDQVDTIEDALPTIGGTWQNEEPQALQFPFAATPGSNIPFSNSTTVVSLFDRFFTEEVWDLLVTETNKYAATHQSDKPHARNSFAVSVDEMRAFVGILILIGICRMQRLHLY